MRRYNRLDLNLLPALRALLTEKHVTRAGEAVYVSQSAMSSILARLRDFFDDPLIVPMGRRMELSPLGERLVTKLDEILLRIDEALEVRPEFDPAKSRRHFVIAASDYTVAVVLMDVIREVCRIAPQVTLEVRQPSIASAAQLDAGEIDFLINPEGVLDAGQSSQVLFEDTFCAVVDAGHPAVGASLTLDQYLALGHVAFNNGGRPMFETWFLREHGDCRRVEVTIGNYSQLAGLVVATPRVATLHGRLAAMVVQVEPLRAVALEFALPRFVQRLHWHKYRDLDPGNLWLRELILARAQRLPATASSPGF